MELKGDASEPSPSPDVGPATVAQPSTRAGPLGAVDRFFRITERGSSYRREFIAALTTFATMSYVLAVHPAILSASGMDRAALVTVTGLAAGLFSALMGLLARLPIAQAPGMGSNAFFAYAIVGTMGVPWEAALGMVFYCGIIFFFLAVTGIRRMLLEAFPEPLKISLTVGIGLFIANIGLKNAGVVVDAEAPVFVKTGAISSGPVLLALTGLILMLVLHRMKIPGAIILSVAVISVAGLFVDGPQFDGSIGPITPVPEQIVGLPASIDSLFLALDFVYLWQNFAFAFPVVMSLLFIDLFSSLVAMQAICQRGGLVDAKGNMYAPKRALSADALATAGGALLGTSTTNCYIESAAGVEAGGRTGLVGVFLFVFFMLALFLSPLLLVIPTPAVAPALILIGIFMFEQVRQIDFSDLAVGGPAALCIILMPVTTISDGLAIGMIVYVLAMLISGRLRELSWLSMGLGAAFLAYYIFVAG